MRLKIESIGEQFVRYLISCENGVYYCNDAWTPDKTKATLWASLPVVKDEWKRLQTEMNSGLVVMHATVVVTIKGADQLTPEQLKALSWHLAAVSGFTLDYSKPMPPGLERVVVSCQIHWDTMRRKKSN